MPIFETLPRESNSDIISSMINLVCPQSGGRMIECQRNGKCCRTWLAEWERAKLRKRHFGRRNSRSQGVS